MEKLYTGPTLVFQARYLSSFIQIRFFALTNLLFLYKNVLDFKRKCCFGYYTFLKAQCPMAIRGGGDYYSIFF